MSNFDFNKHTIVGELNINHNSGHGYVKVYGYMDSYTYYPLSSEEILNTFTPKGEVFAYNIVRDYSFLDKNLIALSVKPNDKDGENWYNYLCDYKRGDVRLIGNPIKNIAKIGTLGEYNYTVLQQNDLLDKDEPTFFNVGDKLYCIKDKNSRLVSYCTITASMPMVKGKYGMYYIGSSLPFAEGIIDITNDKQLISWYIKNIVKVCWHDIQTGNGKLAQDAARKALEATKNLNTTIVKNRLNRLASLTNSYTLTRDELQTLVDAPWLQRSVQKALMKFKEDYINHVIYENAEELNDIIKNHKLEIQKEQAQHDSAIMCLQESKEKALDAYDKTIAQIDSEINANKSKLKTLCEEILNKENTISQLTEQLNKISEKKDSIIADFEIVKQVFNLSSYCTVPKEGIKDNLIINEIRATDVRLPIYQGFKKNFEICLKSYGCKTENINSFSALFKAYSNILFPNMESILATIYATGKCRYTTTYVNVAWKSFDDLWENGLSQIVKSCKESPNEIHYLILRNINLSYVVNYLQPLIDVQMKYTETFPNTTDAYPPNLKVLMTATEDDVIPLTKDSLRYIGCISRKDFKPKGMIHISKIKGLIGYLDMDILNNEITNYEEIIEFNHTDDYINE